MSLLDEILKERLAGVREQNLFRELRRVDSAPGPRIVIGGKTLLNFSSNDYLGLANDPALKTAALDAVNKFGAGAGASVKKARTSCDDPVKAGMPGPPGREPWGHMVPPELSIAAQSDSALLDVGRLRIEVSVRPFAFTIRRDGRRLLRAGFPNLPFFDLSFKVVRHTELKFGKSKLFDKTIIRL